MRSWDDAVEIADGTYTLYGWDYRNRLVTVTDFDSDDEQQQVVAYTYDIHNRLMSRTIQAGGR